MKWEQAQQDYLAGMKYKEIAAKYDVSINTVKSWKQRYHWQRTPKKKNAPKAKKSVHTKSRKGAHKKEASPPELPPELADNDELNDKQKLFCLYYLQRFNAAWAYQKAYQADWNSAHTAGPRLLTNVDVVKLIKQLKARMTSGLYLNVNDILKQYIKQAFADVGDYVEFGNKDAIDPDTLMPYKRSYVYFKDKSEVDTSLINEVHIGQNGAVIKLYDKQKALDRLMDYLPEPKSGEITKDTFVQAIVEGLKEVKQPNSEDDHNADANS